MEEKNLSLREWAIILFLLGSIGSLLLISQIRKNIVVSRLNKVEFTTGKVKNL